MCSCILLLNDAFLGLQHEVAVVLPGVCEVHEGGGEGPESLGVFFPQLLGHVETIHDLALPSLHSLGDAVQKLHLQQHTCTFSLRMKKRMMQFITSTLTYSWSEV